MRLTNPARYNIQYCDDLGSLDRPNGIPAAELESWRTRANEVLTTKAQEKVAFMRQFVVEKPDWFVSAERSARQFVKNLGLRACQGTQITLLDVSKPDDLQVIFPSNDEQKQISADAQSSHYHGIVMRYDRAQQAYDQKGRITIGHVLTHELTHSAEWLSPTVINFYDSGNNTWLQDSRQGPILNMDGSVQGLFYSEGLAEFNAGLYSRRQEQPDCFPVSITDAPSVELPKHYADHRPEKGTPYVAGPDGYSMELFAWGIQERGIATTEDFVRVAHNTYSEVADIRLNGFRTFAKYINAVRPGLYRDLRTLEYGHQTWQEGLEMVYETVTN